MAKKSSAPVDETPAAPAPSVTVEVPAAGALAHSPGMPVKPGKRRVKVSLPRVAGFAKALHSCVQHFRKGAWYGVRGGPDLRGSHLGPAVWEGELDLPDHTEFLRLELFAPDEAGKLEDGPVAATLELL
jgi:hypothetical protein